MPYSNKTVIPKRLSPRFLISCLLEGSGFHPSVRSHADMIALPIPENEGEEREISLRMMRGIYISKEKWKQKEDLPH